MRGPNPVYWYLGALQREAGLPLMLFGSPSDADPQAASLNRRVKQGYNDQGLWMASQDVKAVPEKRHPGPKPHPDLTLPELVRNLMTYATDDEVVAIYNIVEEVWAYRVVVR